MYESYQRRIPLLTLSVPQVGVPRVIHGDSLSFVGYTLREMTKIKKPLAKKEMSKEVPYIVKRSVAGLGLFALREYKRGDFIIQYTGEKISEEEANRRGGKYLFTVTDKITIDGKGRENTARYINHSCAPNAEAERDEDDLIVRISAKRRIMPGEEIFYDYGKEYWNEHIKPFGCRCPKCTGTV